MDNLVTSNIRQRPIRTLVSVAGIALGVSLVMLFTGLARGMSNDLQRRASNVRAELIFMRPGAVQLTATTANLDTRYVERLKAIEGVEEALPVIRHIFQGPRFRLRADRRRRLGRLRADERHQHGRGTRAARA